MSLTDTQIIELAKKMSIPLEAVCFKDELPKKLKPNRAYIINLENSLDEYGNPNVGSHWTYAQVNKYPTGKVEAIYFDPYGQPPPENVKSCIKKTSEQQGVPYTEKDIQSLMNNACGYYCLALGHFLNASKYRSGNLYEDVGTFLDLFDDLNKSIDFKKNEYILKHFFRSTDPELRKEIDVIAPTSNITSQDEKGGVDGFKLPVEIKYNS